MSQFACSVAKSLDEGFAKPNTNTKIERFDNLFGELKNKKVITPVIVKLELSPNSCFDPDRFIRLNEDAVNVIRNGDQIAFSRKVSILQIQDVFHDWAWKLLNSFGEETRQSLIDGFFKSVNLEDKKNESVTVELELLEPVIELIEIIPEASPTLPNIANQANERGKHLLRPQSSRMKQRNSKYSPEIFLLQ